MKRKEIKNEVNLLDLIPEKNIKWEKNKQDLIVLLKPKFQNRFFVKHFLHRLKHPYYRINLDDMGSFIWELFNGVRNVEEIAKIFHDKFGKKAEPLYDRIAVFFQNLEKNHFITFKNLK